MIKNKKIYRHSNETTSMKYLLLIILLMAVLSAGCVVQNNNPPVPPTPQIVYVTVLVTPTQAAYSVPSSQSIYLSVPSMSINPVGSLTPSTPVTALFKIDVPGVFPSDGDLQLFTDLDQPKWTYSIIVNGIENSRPVSGGRILSINGVELNHRDSDVVSVRVTLEGIAPPVTQTSTKTIIRITQYNSNGKPITSSQVEKTALVINTGEVASTIASADAALQVFRTHIDERAALGFDTSAAEIKYNEAMRKIASVRSRPSSQYTDALADLNAASVAIREGENALKLH
jgi:hypothetical protein